MIDMSDYVAVQIPGDFRARIIKVKLSGSDKAMTYDEELILYFLNESVKLREQRGRLVKQNRELKDALIRWRERTWPGTDQRAVIERDFPAILAEIEAENRNKERIYSLYDTMFLVV